MSQQIGCAAVDGFLRYNMFTFFSKSLDSIGDGRRTRGQSQSSRAAL